MVRPLANGRPGTEVIPAQWGQSHARVAAGTMTARVSLRAPGSRPGFNEERKRTESTADTPFASNVPARIQAIQETRTGSRAAADVADERVLVTGYLVSIARDVRNGQMVAEGVLIEVTASDDPKLTGRTLRVNDIVRGSLRFERNLLCSLNT